MLSCYNEIEEISSSDNYVKNLYFFAHSLRIALKWTDFFTGGFCYVGIFTYNVGIFNWLWGRTYKEQDTGKIDTDTDIEDPVEICDDELDNDTDGLIDCFDDDCAGDATVLKFAMMQKTMTKMAMLIVMMKIVLEDENCEVEDEEFCTDLQDNDGDGLIDCADIDCEADPACADNTSGGSSSGGNTSEETLQVEQQVEMEVKKFAMMV